MSPLHVLHPLHSTGIPLPLYSTQPTHVTTPLHPTQTTNVTPPLHTTLACVTSTLQATQATNVASPFSFPRTTGLTYPHNSIQTAEVRSPLYPTQPVAPFLQSPDDASRPQIEEITEARPPAMAEHSEYLAGTSPQSNEQVSHIIPSQNAAYQIYFLFRNTLFINRFVIIL